MCRVYTIGYEGRTLDDFLVTLQENGIERIVDVREIPLSRKPGFSKGALSRALEGSGIAYEHFKELGSPKPIRDELRRTHDYLRFFADYHKYLVTQLPSVQDVYERALFGKTCLLCFERNPEECHRLEIANYLKDIMPDVEEVVNL